MRYDKYGSRIIQKIGFQPGNGFHIQMVSGLVQKDDIRTGEKKAAKGHPGFLASGKSRDLFVEVLFLKSKAFQYSCNLAFISIAVFLLKFLGKTGIGFHDPGKLLPGGMFHFFLQFPHAPFHVQDMLLHFQERIVYGKLAVDLLMLCQISDSFAFCQDYLTAV